MKIIFILSLLFHIFISKNHFFFVLKPTGNCGPHGKHCDECGFTHFKNNLQIVGGSEALPHSWPFVALIKQAYSGNIFIEKLNKSVRVHTSLRCSGTLIDRNTVLTAAHCIDFERVYSENGVNYKYRITPNEFYPTLESTYTVFLGLHNLSHFNQHITVNATINKIIKHEEYDDNTSQNDIALLKLSNEVKLNKYIQISCLPTTDYSKYLKSKTKAYAIGWGTTTFRGDASNILRNVDLKIYDNETCNSLDDTPRNYRKQICAGDLSGKHDTCQGDSGGPLLVKDNELGRYVNVGIVSYGVGCAEKNKAAIYTRVSNYLDWIRSNI